jgi:hypothetical protein
MAMSVALAELKESVIYLSEGDEIDRDRLIHFQDGGHFGEDCRGEGRFYVRGVYDDIYLFTRNLSAWNSTETDWSPSAVLKQRPSVLLPREP